MAKHLTQKTNKNLCSQPKIIFLGFKALCSKTDFSHFSEKEMASLFKNGHFKNVQFRKIATQIYSMFLCGLLLLGTQIYMKYIVCETTSAPTYWRPTCYQLCKN